jgi:hypothetical protein
MAGRRLIARNSPRHGGALPRALAAGLLFAMTPLPASAQPPPPPPESTEPRRLNLETEIPERPALSLTPDQRWPVELEVWVTCLTCPDAGGPPITNLNAPWSIAARVRRGDDRNWVSFGVVGQRNARLPLFMTTLPGELAPGDEPASSWTATGDPRTHWQAVVQAERTLWDGPGSDTLGVLGEAFLPLALKTGPPAAGDAPRAPSRAVRGAFRVRF